MKGLIMFVTASLQQPRTKSHVDMALKFLEKSTDKFRIKYLYLIINMFQIIKLQICPIDLYPPYTIPANVLRTISLLIIYFWIEKFYFTSENIFLVQISFKKKCAILMEDYYIYF